MENACHQEAIKIIIPPRSIKNVGEHSEDSMSSNKIDDVMIINK